MDNTKVPSQNPKPSLSSKLKPAQLIALIITAILIVAVIIFLIAGLSKPQPTVPEIPSTSETILETTGEARNKPQPPSVPIKITSYIGTVKFIDGATIQLEVSNEKNPAIQGAQIINVNVTKQTALIQRIRPAQIPTGADLSQLFKQKPITIKDLQIGDEIIAAGGGEDLFGQTQFTAASIMKIIITS